MLSAIEMKRAQNALDALMAARRPAPHLRDQVDLAFRIAGQSAEIYEIRPVWNKAGETREVAVAKATYVRSQNIWKLYWQRRDLKWHGYEPRMEVRTIEEAIAEIDADPYACFWG